MWCPPVSCTHRDCQLWAELGAQLRPPGLPLILSLARPSQNQLEQQDVALQLLLPFQWWEILTQTCQRNVGTQEALPIHFHPAVHQQLMENLWLSEFLEKAACAQEPEHPESRIPHMAFPAHLQPLAAAMIQVTLVLPLGASDSFRKTLCWWWRPWNLCPPDTSQALQQSQQTQRGSCPP